MTRKRWRKLMMAEAVCRRNGYGMIMDTGRVMNDLRHAKMVRGYDGELYWSNTNRPVACDSYAEHMAMYRGCWR